MYLKRDVYPALEAHLSSKQATVITGMRRTGKTTLLKKLMEVSEIGQKLFFDMERLDNRALFSEENYEKIVFALGQRGIRFSEPVLFGIDEIQLVPNLPSVVKYLYDHYGVKFILTGSSSYYLKNRFDESLAGRKRIFEVYPLSFGEMLTFKGVEHVPGNNGFVNLPFSQPEYVRLRHFYEEYIDFGGFPEVVLTDGVKFKMDYLSDIVSSYIHHDVASILDFKKTTDAYKLLKLLAVRVGTRLEISKISMLTGMNRRAVEDYVSLFEQTYLIRTIPVTSTSPDREIVKARKLYFLDNGIASMSAELGSGTKFENAVFNQLRHFGEVSYYALKSGKEIDFVLDKQTAFEVKETPIVADLNSTASLAKNLGIEKVQVIGRKAEQVFEGFVWGGDIR